MTKEFESKVGLNSTKETDELIKESRKSLLLRVGWSKNAIEERIRDEIKMTNESHSAKYLQNQYDLRDKLILDVGSGIGGLVVQLGLSGAKVLGVEPSREYAIITQKRIAKYGLSNKCQCIRAPGEFLPFSVDTFDCVICFYVLEHTNDPYSVIRGIIRVTKPNGIILIRTENYFSFWEPHYRILWFPLMPKRLAKFYLSLRGKDPYFFDNHITYTTFFSLHTYIKKLDNVIDLKRNIIIEKLQNPESIQSPLKRFLVNTFRFVGLNKTPFLRLILLILYLRDILKPNITFDLKKVNDKDS